MRDKRTPQSSAIKAVVLVFLLYVCGGVLTSIAARLGLPEERIFLPSIFVATCGFFLLDRTIISRESMRRAGSGALIVAFVLGLVGAAAAISPAFLLAVEKNDYELETFTWYEALHSVVLAPIAEEILFTGFLYTALRAKHKLLAATVIVATLFTLAHLPSSVSSFSVRFAHAVCSCLLFEKYRCLPLNIGVHSLANAFPVAIAGAPSLWLALVPAMSTYGYVLGAISIVGTFAIALWLFIALQGSTPFRRNGDVAIDLRGPDIL